MKRVPSAVVTVFANVGNFIQENHASGARVRPQASDSPQTSPGQQSGKHLEGEAGDALLFVVC